MTNWPTYDALMAAERRLDARVAAVPRGNGVSDADMAARNAAEAAEYHQMRDELADLWDAARAEAIGDPVGEWLFQGDNPHRAAARA